MALSLASDFGIDIGLGELQVDIGSMEEGHSLLLACFSCDQIVPQGLPSLTSMLGISPFV